MKRSFLTNYAFSLIELMVTVAIIGILAAVSLPMYKNYNIRANIAKMRSMGEQVLSQVQEDFTLNGGKLLYSANQTLTGYDPLFIASATILGPNNAINAPIGSIYLEGVADAIIKNQTINLVIVPTFIANTSSGGSMIQWSNFVNSSFLPYAPTTYGACGTNNSISKTC